MGSCTGLSFMQDSEQCSGLAATAGAFMPIVGVSSAGLASLGGTSIEAQPCDSPDATIAFWTAAVRHKALRAH